MDGGGPTRGRDQSSVNQESRLNRPLIKRKRTATNRRRKCPNAEKTGEVDGAIPAVRQSSERKNGLNA